MILKSIRIVLVTSIVAPMVLGCVIILCFLWLVWSDVRTKKVLNKGAFKDSWTHYKKHMKHIWNPEKFDFPLYDHLAAKKKKS